MKQIFPGIYEDVHFDRSINYPRCPHTIVFPSTVTGMAFNHTGVVTLADVIKRWLEEHRNCETPKMTCELDGHTLRYDQFRATGLACTFGFRVIICSDGGADFQNDCKCKKCNSAFEGT